MKIPILVVAVSLFSLWPVEADDFAGAGSLMQSLHDLATAPTPTPPASPVVVTHPAVDLEKDIAAYELKSQTMAPKEAAAAWIQLFNRACDLQANGACPANAVMAVLPGPTVWPELENQMEAMGKAPQTWNYLRLAIIVHTLNNEEDKQWQDLSALLDSDHNPKKLKAVIDICTALSAVAGHPDAVEKFWTKLLTYLSAKNIQDEVPVSLEIPDFVTLLGEARAEPLLTQALLSPNVNVINVHGRETETLARKIALANIDKMTSPPWALTLNLDAAPLYDALSKKFGANSSPADSIGYHILSLVIAGKPDDAVIALGQSSTDFLSTALEEADEAGYAPQVYAFLHALLQARPDVKEWDDFVRNGALADKSDEALQFVKDTLAKPELKDDVSIPIRGVLYKALLAVDKVDEAEQELRMVITAHKGKPQQGYLVMNWDLELAEIGRLTGNSTLEEQWLNEAIAQEWTNQSIAAPDWEETPLILYLLKTGHNVEAEKLIIKTILANTKVAQENVGQANRYQAYQAYNTRALLVQLMQVYYNAGRWSDILTLVDQAPGWGLFGFSNIACDHVGADRYSYPDVGVMVARAMAELRQTRRALPVLRYTLQVDPSKDAGYALLLKLQGGNDADQKTAISLLDDLFKQDQFENRPLIWKANLLLQQGNLVDAEAVCKTAITIDPSDGETGKGDRMREYSVMADICDAKKDTDRATFFRNVVKAIRLSENADDYYDAGLLTRAITMYSQALDIFSDAYCIQSRIARQLAARGRTDEAALHYRKAFELMPTSFGRMESHCFGCEKAFLGKSAGDIAEKTFTDLLAKDPNKPQLYYLLGYLYMEQGRNAEAVKNFQKAGQLDNDYINAWKQITQIGDSYQIAPEVRDEASFNLMRLDPFSKHTSVQFQKIRQLSKLWDLIHAIPPTVEPPFSDLPALNGSSVALDELKAQPSAIPSSSGSDGTTITLMPLPVDAAALEIAALERLSAAMAPSMPNGKTVPIMENEVIKAALGGDTVRGLAEF